MIIALYPVVHARSFLPFDVVVMMIMLEDASKLPYGLCSFFECSVRLWPDHHRMIFMKDLRNQFS